MAINRFVVLALIFVAMVAYVSAGDTPAAPAGDGADAAKDGGAPSETAGAPDAAGAAEGPSAGGASGATSAAAPAEGNAPSVKACGVYAVVAAIVVVGCFF